MCGQPVALNWRSREMAMHRDHFSLDQTRLIQLLTKIDIRDFGYGTLSGELMHPVRKLNQLLEEQGQTHSPAKAARFAP